MRRDNRRSRMAFAAIAAIAAGLMAIALHLDPRDRSLSERVAQMARSTGEYLRPPV